MNVYEMVTARIIEALESGVIPWNKPWSGNPDGAFNRISRKPYGFINQIMLLHSGEYATFKQWQSLGGRIRKGEKSEIVVFWKIYHKEEEQDDGTTKKITVPVLKYYNVFHISQVDGVEPLEVTPRENDPIEAAENVKNDYITRSGIGYAERVGDKAFYSPLRDYVEVPTLAQYEDVSEFYSTVFHELTHSTGHKSRLDRFSDGRAAAFGGEEYSKEELTAEIGSACILNILGIETPKSFRNSAGYIQGWLSALKNDPRMIVSASARAEKAANLILNR